MLVTKAFCAGSKRVGSFSVDLLRRYVGIGAGLGSPGQTSAVFHTHLAPHTVQGGRGRGVSLGGIFHGVSPQFKVQSGGAGGFLQEIVGAPAASGAVCVIAGQVGVGLIQTGAVLQILLGGRAV